MLTPEEQHTVNMIGGRSFHNTNSTYWLPNDDNENERLETQHFTVKSIFDGNYSPRVRHYVSMEDHNTKVLDCGCGPGTWIIDMAKEHPNCQFFGVDISNVFQKVDVPSNVHFEIGNVLKALPFDDHTFDFINLRYLIFAFREEEWPAVLKELYRVLKPGGVIQSVECGDQPTANDFVRTAIGHVEAVMQSLGQDPCIARHMPRHLRDSGLLVIETDKRHIHFGQKDPISQALLLNVVSIGKNIQPYLAPPMNLPTDKAYDDLLTRFAFECQQEPHTTWTAVLNLAIKPL